MNPTRREVVQGIVAMFGGATLLDVDGFLARYAEPARKAVAASGVGAFGADDVGFLDEVAETILPETSTPGAKAAQTGAFMALMVTDTYSEQDQQVFRAGMKTLDDASRKASGKPFMEATPAQRLALLEVVDRERYEYQKGKKSGDPSHYFSQMKWLAMQGYFTSEIGYTQALRYLETPGRYDPCVPYTKGDKIWASHA
jgi:hypothetical protein